MEKLQFYDMMSLLDPVLPLGPRLAFMRASTFRPTFDLDPLLALGTPSAQVHSKLNKKQ